MSRLEILKSLHYPHRAVGARLELDESLWRLFAKLKTESK
jgi:hypothetical protein